MRAKLLGEAVPVAVGFEITHLCNLACAYCDRHTPAPNEMSYEQVRSALNGLIELGMQEISLDGGEPLTFKRIDEIVSELVERRLIVRMNTNGILVPRHVHTVRKLHKVKISLDGPEAVHDKVRGPRAFARALRGAMSARDWDVPVEFTCVVGQHNHLAIDELLNIAASVGIGVVFQPARDSLFLAPLIQLSGARRQHIGGPGTRYKLAGEQVRDAFGRIEAYKKQGLPVLNGWASLRHFRDFPQDKPLPCAAGWINLTLDPCGNLYHCGQVSRDDKNNVIELGVAEAFRRLQRVGCAQCWCARVVEENYAWGGRWDLSMPPL